MRINDRLALVASLQFGISGPLDCHVWAVRGPEGIVLIDSGGGTHTSLILDLLEDDFGSRRPAAILLTHCHPDHSFGASSLRQLTGCDVYAPELSASVIETADAERSGLRAAQRMGVYPPDFAFRPCPVQNRFRDGDTLHVAGLDFDCLHVRGHSPDSFCFLLQQPHERWLFSGDVLFYGGVLGVTNIEGSGMDGYRADLPKLGGLAIGGLFPGHGLFTVSNGQRHIDAALEQAARNFLPRQIGQGDLIF